MVTEPTSAPVIVLVATPRGGGRVAGAGDGAGAGRLAKATTVELSEVTVLPAASWIVAVSTRVAPEVRLAVAPLRAIWAAAPWTTVKAPSVPVVSPAAVASIVTGADEGAGDRLRGDAAGGGRVAGAGDGAGAGRLAKATTVVLSEVTVLPAASWIVAVRTRVAPEVRFGGRAGEGDSAAAPWTTVKEPSVPVVRPAAVASMSTEPTSAPVIVFVATPPAAVAVPVPVTVPAPDCLAKVTTVVLSEVTVLPAASWIVAVSTRVAPEVRLAVEPVSAIWAAAPWTTVNAPSVPVVSPAAVASIVTEPTSDAGDRLGGDAGGGGGVAGAGDGAGAGRLAKVTTVVLSEVTVLPAASWIVAVRTRVAPEVRLAVAPVSAIWAAAPWTTVKAPSVPVVRPGGRRLHRRPGRRGRR